MKIKFLVVLLFLAGCSTYRALTPLQNADKVRFFYDYRLDLNDTKDDEFHVVLYVDSLNDENNEFNFVSTIPGTYSILDIGRFVTSFKAYDNLDQAIDVNQVSVNKFQFSNPEKVKKIEYKIRETWDTEVDSNEVARMSGTSIEKDHVLLNTHAVFGYIKGLRDEPYRVKIDYPNGWKVGSAAQTWYQNNYFFTNFTDMIHTPFLFGNLSVDKFNVDGINVAIYAYSHHGINQASQFHTICKEIVDAGVDYMKRKPTEYYTFLFHFDDRTIGAHEHPRSSTYVFKENEYKKLEYIAKAMTSHEFLHLETPFYLSEKNIQNFNFEKPVPTEHLWFYEGITEWAATMLLLQNDLISFERYFYLLSNDVKQSRKMKPGLSLIDLSLQSYSDPDQYKYIYSKGALTATLLDLQILKATNGKMRLHDVIIKLAQKYNSHHPFNAGTFIDEFIQYSDPSVRSFFNEYIAGTENLPLSRYFDYLGVSFYEELNDTRGRSSLGYGIYRDDISQKYLLKNIEDRLMDQGFMENDTLISISGIQVNDESFDKIYKSLMLHTTNVGVEYRALIKRQDGGHTLKGKTVPLIFKAVFIPSQNSGSVEKKHFRKWSGH